MAPIAPFLPPKLAAFLAISCCKIHALVCIISLILLKFNVLLRLPGSNELLILPNCSLLLRLPGSNERLILPSCSLLLRLPGANELLISAREPISSMRAISNVALPLVWG